MNLANKINIKIYENKKYFDIKSKISYKNKSDNSLQNIFCSQFKKSLITGSNQISEASTKNTLLGLNEKNRKIKKGSESNIIDELSPENIDKIITNKIKVFEALENILKIDNEYEEQIRGGDVKDINKLSLQKMNIIKEKRVKCLSVPKLDFTNIFNQYNCKPFYIKEVNYISSYSMEDSDYNSIFENNEKIKNNNNHGQYCSEQSNNGLN